MGDRGRAYTALGMSTLAFTVCFAAWLMNGVLVTHLVDNRVLVLDRAQIGWLLGTPVLTGSILRLPVGVLADRHGGRRVFVGVMLIAAAGCWMVSYADSCVPVRGWYGVPRPSPFAGLLAGALVFGVAGTSFAVGVEYTSAHFPESRQGTALGIFGTGNMGSGLTTLLAPAALGWLTREGAEPSGWRDLPRGYAIVLVVTAAVFWFATHDERPATAPRATLKDRLAVLRVPRVWRLSAYYFLCFGAFVGLSQWLVPYYVSAYSLTVSTAGILASVFSLPSSLVRALGGWLSDRFGARRVMYVVLVGTVSGCLLLVLPRMDVYSPSESVLAPRPGVVTAVTETHIVVDDVPCPYTARPRDDDRLGGAEDALILPQVETWQEPVVRVGDVVVRRQVLAHGRTHIFFQANLWIFTVLVLLVGLCMGVGKAAVYKHIPHYFPSQVGVVGGMVGVIGGLGGFVCPILFGYLLKGTGLWTSCWAFLAVFGAACLAWMHVTVLRMRRPNSQ